MSLNLTAKTNALTAVAASVASVATSVSELFNTGTKSISMLDTMVSTAAAKQSDRTKIELAEYREHIIMEASSREAETAIQVEEFIAKSPKHAQHFNSSYAKFSALFAEPTKA